MHISMLPQLKSQPMEEVVMVDLDRGRLRYNEKVSPTPALPQHTAKGVTVAPSSARPPHLFLILLPAHHVLSESVLPLSMSRSSIERRVRAPDSKHARLWHRA